MPGTVDLHRHAHVYAVVVKSHEDTLSCLDALWALRQGVLHAHGAELPMGRFISDRAWAFLHSNMEFLGADNQEAGMAAHGSCYAHFMRALDKAGGALFVF